MAKISKHFSESEFACKCGCNSEVIVSRDLLDLLEGLRVSLGEAILVTSGARCKSHNIKVGGATSSWHVPRNYTLYASDITYWDSKKRGKMDILKLYVLADGFGASGLGLYDGRIHIDQRPSKRARWTHSSWDWTNGS
tara:strand:+ start:636 stop:1049 length:414 start_codon:yes stop_codon:yes gene_type:complete